MHSNRFPVSFCRRRIFRIFFFRSSSHTSVPSVYTYSFNFQLPYFTPNSEIAPMLLLFIEQLPESIVAKLIFVKLQFFCFSLSCGSVLTFRSSKFLQLRGRGAYYQNVMHYSVYRGISIECDV